MEKIHIGVAVPVSCHSKLTALAKERKISMADLVRELLAWAGEQSGPALARAGVRIPLWPHELSDGSGRVD